MYFIITHKICIFPDAIFLPLMPIDTKVLTTIWINANVYLLDIFNIAIFICIMYCHV